MLCRYLLIDNFDVFNNVGPLQVIAIKDENDVLLFTPAFQYLEQPRIF